MALADAKGAFLINERSRRTYSRRYIHLRFVRSSRSAKQSSDRFLLRAPSRPSALFLYLFLSDRRANNADASFRRSREFRKHRAREAFAVSGFEGCACDFTCVWTLRGKLGKAENLCNLRKLLSLFGLFIVFTPVVGYNS